MGKAALRGAFRDCLASYLPGTHDHSAEARTDRGSRRRRPSLQLAPLTRPQKHSKELRLWAETLVATGTVFEEVDPEKEETQLFRFQGDRSFYTNDALRKRQQVRHNKDLMKVLDSWWKLLPKVSPSRRRSSEASATRYERATIAKETYIRAFQAVAPVLEEVGKGGAEKNTLEADWLYDFNNAKEKRMQHGVLSPLLGLHREGFFDAAFDLIDTWVNSLSTEHYVDFAQRCVSQLETTLESNPDYFVPFASSPRRERLAVSSPKQQAVALVPCTPVAPDTTTPRSSSLTSPTTRKPSRNGDEAVDIAEWLRGLPTPTEALTAKHTQCGDGDADEGPRDELARLAADAAAAGGDSTTPRPRSAPVTFARGKMRRWEGTKGLVTASLTPPPKLQPKKEHVSRGAVKVDPLTFLFHPRRAALGASVAAACAIIAVQQHLVAEALREEWQGAWLSRTLPTSPSTSSPSGFAQVVQQRIFEQPPSPPVRVVLEAPPDCAQWVEGTSNARLA